jgi:hypothetical protein
VRQRSQVWRENDADHTWKHLMNALCYGRGEAQILLRRWFQKWSG